MNRTSIEAKSMSGLGALIDRIRFSEWSLRVLLVLLAVDVFVFAPIAQGDTLPALRPVVHSIVLLSGIAVAFRSRARTIPVLVGVLAVASFATHWIFHAHPTISVGRVDTTLSLVFCGFVAWVTLSQVFGDGPITLRRIEGAVTVYLLFAYAWALAYQLVALSDPLAFHFPEEPLHQTLRFKLLYFSTTTLTTVSYGDITPLNPIARSLAALEGAVGQLFPALLLTRLVAMELYHRQRRER